MAPDEQSQLREGVIKFSSDHSVEALRGQPRATAEALIGWRNLLRRARLIGLDPERYDGVGYGNVSARVDKDSFVVSGTQTSAREVVSAKHFVRIDEWNIDQNRVVSTGELEPSSETMTHAMLYELSAATECVLHVHSAEIWTKWKQLGLPTTPVGVAYGTSDMALEVRRRWESGDLASGAFAMLGHEDGVVAFGRSIEAAGVRLMTLFARALDER